MSDDPPAEDEEARCAALRLGWRPKPGEWVRVWAFGEFTREQVREVINNEVAFPLPEDDLHTNGDIMPFYTRMKGDPPGLYAEWDMIFPILRNE